MGWRKALDQGELWEMLVAELTGGNVSPKGRQGYDVVTRRKLKLEVKHTRRLKGKRGWRVHNMDGKEMTLIFCLNRTATRVSRVLLLPKGNHPKRMSIPSKGHRCAGNRFWEPHDVTINDLLDLFGC